jgi:3',5'-cyclic AMP phosphodiesterase CpdA
MADKTSMKIIQITDIHLVDRGKRLHGLDPTHRLEACIANINTKNPDADLCVLTAKNPDADLCVLTGDLAHNGTIGAYENLRDLLRNLSIPYHFIIGNHDNRENFRKVFPGTPCDENGFAQSVIDAAAGRFLRVLIVGNAENGSNPNSRHRTSDRYTCSCTTPRLK